MTVELGGYVRPAFDDLKYLWSTQKNLTNLQLDIG